MKVLLPILLLYSCYGYCQDYKKAFKKITLKIYSKYEITDTLINKNDYRVLACTKPGEAFTGNITVIEKQENNKVLHYELDNFAYFENDSTIIYDNPPLKIEGGKSSYEEGVWFYAEFYREKKSWEKIESGIRFRVDSLPPLITKPPMTKAPGIYMINNNILEKVSDDQSELSFYKLAKTGFYYLPAPGKFYVRFKINQVK